MPSSRSVQNSPREAKRLSPLRPAGIPENSRALFWRGETAGKLVDARTRAARQLEEQKKAERAAKKKAPRARKRGFADECATACQYAKDASMLEHSCAGKCQYLVNPPTGRTKRERTPDQELKRLQRALKRRKTLAARQRVEAKIKQLSRALGLAC